MSAYGGKDWRNPTTRGQCTRRMARVWFQCVEMVSLFLYMGGWLGGQSVRLEECTGYFYTCHVSNIFDLKKKKKSNKRETH